jgi:rubrerythrin
MTHDHDHHHHHHSHDAPSELTVEEKLGKLLDHWVKHNEEHATTYVTWADRAKEKGLGDIESQLKEAAEKTRSISENFKAASASLKKL